MLTSKPKKKPFPLLRWLGAGLVGLAFVGLLAYVLLMQEHIRTTEVDSPLITAPDLPVKRRPEDPGGMAFANRDKSVFDLLAPEVKDGTAEIVLAPMDKMANAPTNAPASTKPAPLEEGTMAEPIVASTVTPLEVAEAVPAPFVAPQPAPKAPQKAPEKVVEKVVEKSTGAWGVQLASFTTKADAERAIKTFQTRFTDELGTLTGQTQTVDLAGKGARSRVQFFGLASKNSAQDVCRQLTAKKQGCLVVSQ